jgi:hypothetical protein
MTVILDHIIATETLHHIIATVSFDTIVAFHTDVAYVIFLVAILMSLLESWHEEHLWNVTILLR